MYMFLIYFIDEKAFQKHISLCIGFKFQAKDSEWNGFLKNFHDSEKENKPTDLLYMYQICISSKRFKYPVVVISFLLRLSFRIKT